MDASPHQPPEPELPTAPSPGGGAPNGAEASDGGAEPANAGQAASGGQAPNGGELLASAGPASTPLPGTPIPVAPVPAHRHPRNRSIIAAIALLVASVLVGFGARGGWFSSDTSSNAVATAPDSRTSTVDDSPGSDTESGVDAGSVAESVEDAVVNITTTTDGGNGAGTGMIITRDGLVLTNHHVISGAREVQVEIGGDGELYDAHVVGYALDDDVALVQIEDVSDLPTIASEDDIVANDSVLVMGNALGRGGEPTVSTGRIVATDQQITASDGTGLNAETLTGMIQVEASVQPGQSGGAVVNADGEVVGMTTAATVDGGFRYGFQNGSNEAYAIPIERALAVADEIDGGRSTERVHVGPRAVLGVSVQADLFGRDGLGAGAEADGVPVGDVSPGGPAAAAGITAGSTITAVNGTEVRSTDDITRAMNELAPGDECEVTWTDPQGSTRTATLEVDEGPPA